MPLLINADNATISINSSIENAIKNIEKSSLKIVLVVDENNNYVGVVTDGDIRRSILNENPLSDLVSKIVNFNSSTLPPNSPREVELELMASKKIQQVPAIKDKKICGIFQLDALMSRKSVDNIFFIMAGGRGSRMMPHTESIPKPMLKINGTPMLELLIKRAKNNGFNNFIISLHYLGNVIKDYFGNGQSMGVNIDYLEEEKPLGTAGALSLLNLKNYKDSVIVTNADLITDISYIDMLDFHKVNNASATMAIKIYDLQNPYGVVHTDKENIIGFEEKPVIKSKVNAGIYVIEPNVFELIEKNESIDMPIFFQRLKLKNKKIIAYHILDQWKDVGSPADLAMIIN